MKFLICLAYLLCICSSQVVSHQRSATVESRYAFIMVINKEGTKLYFSPVFSFDVDKRGNPECDLGQLEKVYRTKVADEKFDVITSDHFDSAEEAATARGVYIDSEKRAGRAIVESTVEVGSCSG